MTKHILWFQGCAECPVGWNVARGDFTSCLSGFLCCSWDWWASWSICKWRQGGLHWADPLSHYTVTSRSLLAWVDEKIQEYETIKVVSSAQFSIKFSILANDVLQCPPDLSKCNNYTHIQFLLQWHCYISYCSWKCAYPNLGVLVLSCWLTFLQ